MIACRVARPLSSAAQRLARNDAINHVISQRRMEVLMLTGSLLWLLGVPIPLVILLWFFFLRGR